MATYGHYLFDAAPSGIHWYDLEIIELVDATNFFVDFLLSDGTNLRIAGNGDFTYDAQGPIGGTVTFVARQIINVLNYEFIAGLQIPLVDLFNAPTKADVFNKLMAGTDTLTGWSGTDYLLGGPGGDALDGSGGTDIADYASSADGVIVNLAHPTANSGHAFGDTYVSREGVRGSVFADTLTGDATDNVLLGDAGIDMLDGGGGADALDGGDGFDTVSYASAIGGITGNLDVGIGAGGDAAGDSYAGIEALKGSNFGDTLVGKAGVANSLDGSGGDDFLYGEGIDTVVGGSGDDVFFGGQGSGLNINLATASIETVWGSFVGDIMDGSASSTNLTMVGQGLTGG